VDPCPMDSAPLRRAATAPYGRPVIVGEMKPSQLHVTYNDTATVAVSDRVQRLRKKTSGLALRQSPLATHVRVQVLGETRRHVRRRSVHHVHVRRADDDLGSRVDVRVITDGGERQKHRVAAVERQNLSTTTYMNTAARCNTTLPLLRLKTHKVENRRQFPRSRKSEPSFGTCNVTRKLSTPKIGKSENRHHFSTPITCSISRSIFDSM